MRGLVRERDGHRLVSLFLVNEQDVRRRPLGAALAVPGELTVAAADGVARCSCAARSTRSALAPAVDREELAGLEMQYRDSVELAVGHGVGVAGHRGRRASPAAARGSQTAAMPAEEVPLHRGARPEDFDDARDPRAVQRAVAALDMQTLAEAERRRAAGAARRRSPMPTRRGSPRRSGGSTTRTPGWTASTSAARRHLEDARDDRGAASAPGSPRSRTRTSPRRSASPTTRCGSSASTRSPPSRAAATTRCKLHDAVAHADVPDEPLVAAVPARVRAAEPPGARRPDAPRAHGSTTGSSTCCSSRPAAARPRPTSA